MRKNLIALVFLGLTTAGFANHDNEVIEGNPYTVTAKGRAELVENSETHVRLRCNSSSSTCYQLKGTIGNHNVKLLVPDYNIDVMVIMATVNDRPVESLPSELPGNGTVYNIQFRPSDLSE